MTIRPNDPWNPSAPVQAPRPVKPDPWMPVSIYTREYAREVGYIGNSPAMLKGFEMMRQAGIREARKAHFERVAELAEFKAHPEMFFAAVRPALSIDEAISDANRTIALYRRTPTYRRDALASRVVKAKLNRVYARYFRRFGERVWAMAEAA